MMLLHTFYNIIHAYWSDRHFQVKLNEEYKDLFQTKSGVTQGSVHGPILYLVYTADLPTNEETMTNFVDDTAVLVTDKQPIRASEKLQNALNSIET